MRFIYGSMLLVALIATGCDALSEIELEPPWPRHTIDDASQGADGVRLADVDGDGRLDIATGWEEGGRIRAYLNPGPETVRRRWPAVTVGEVGAPEDAVFADLDSDGAIDVVSSSEGDTRTVWIHWAPTEPDRYLNPTAWSTDAIAISRDAMRWMFCVPVQVDGTGGVDLVAGAKNDGAKIGWFESPSDPRDPTGWRWHPVRDAGWIMSLVAVDMDADGDLDILASDRRGDRRGVFWLDNPGPGVAQILPWPEHRIGADDEEVMFLDYADLDQDGSRDVVVALAERRILYLRQNSDAPADWTSFPIAIPSTAGTGKSVRVGDIDLDGRLDIVLSCENADDKIGVMWMSYVNAPTDPLWLTHNVSGRVGTKYDLVELIDLDDDGDLDILTCEERDDLGVVWYENPTRP